MAALKGFSKAIILILFLCLTYPQCIFSQPKNLKFERLTSAEGLPAFAITCIIQDKQGFLYGTEAVELITRQKPDVALIDIDMPDKNGFQVLKEVKGTDTRIVFLTMHKEENIFSEAMDKGVSGYVLKESATEDVSECIAAVYKGEIYISPQISGFLVSRLKRQKELREELKGMESLTPAEMKILKMIADDKTTKEISEELFISYRTVEKHRTNISAKLGLSGSHSLLKFVIENKARL